MQDLDDPSLTPPLAILDHAQILREIMSVYASSHLGDEDESESAAGFQRILDIMVDPAIEMCTSASEKKERVRPRWDRAIFVLNCLSYLQVCISLLSIVDAGNDLYFFGGVRKSVLEPFSFTLEKQKMVQSVIDARVKLLTDEHVRLAFQFLCSYT